MKPVGTKVFAFLSAGADVKANAFGGGGALEVTDLGLLEDGSERCDALDSDHVRFETVKERQSGHGEGAGVHIDRVTHPQEREREELCR